jgi:hypothetical protein
MYLSPGRAKAVKAYEEFLRLYEAKYPKAWYPVKGAPRIQEAISWYD